MEIDIEKAKEEFLKYTEKYDLKNEEIKERQSHSLRVMEMSKIIAQKINLSEEEVNLATLIGLLHDIARFEQYTQYGTFWDKVSFDHGDYGVKILDKDIRNYIQTDKYDEIIKKAIKNHNKFKIEEGLTEREYLFAKLIRDADKLDIFFEAINVFDKKVEEKKVIEEGIIVDEIMEEFKKEKTKNRDERVHEYTPIDSILEIIMFIFDINYMPSYEILREKRYIDKIIDKYNFKENDTKEKIEEIRKISNNYIERKLIIY